MCLPMRNMGFDSWLDSINDGCCCDELAVLALSAVYHRHTLVVTKNKFWSAIESAVPVEFARSDETLYCSIAVYGQSWIHGVLKWKPSNPKPLPPPPPPSTP